MTKKHGSIIEGALKLLRKRKGATRKDVLKRLGWAAVSIQRITRGKGKLIVYRAKTPFIYRLISDPKKTKRAHPKVKAPWVKRQDPAWW